MTIKILQLEKYLTEFLSLDNFAGDPSQNGLQVQPGNTQIKKIALAVDANLLTVQKAVAWGADLLMVHHGIFWHDSPLLIGRQYQLIKLLLDSGVGLYACHLPLDAHQEIGNNMVFAKKLALEKLAPFDVGYWGQLESACSPHVLLDKCQLPTKQIPRLLNFGKTKIKTVGIISGGAGNPGYIQQAANLNLDLFITGEINHAGGQLARDLSLNVWALGHYWTETFGIKALGEHLKYQFKLETAYMAANTYL